MHVFPLAAPSTTDARSRPLPTPSIRERRAASGFCWYYFATARNETVPIRAQRPAMRMQQMIDHYSDHAANERTFLAWVRTAIAVMAFGFLVAKFNLFLKVAAQSLAGAHGRRVPVPGGGFGDVAGLILIIAGTAMVAMAAVRFIRTGQAIESAERRPGGARMDLALSALMVILGVALAIYVSHALLA